MNMSSLWGFIRQHRSFFREITVYAIQTQSLTVLGLASAIVIPRILSQEAYGLYGVIFSIAGILAMTFSFGVVPLVGNRLLQGALDAEERAGLFVFIRRTFAFGTLAAAVTCSFLALRTGPLTALYVFLAYVTGQWLGYLPLLYYREVREHAVRSFVWLDTAIGAGKILFPLAGLVIWRGLAGYFGGLIIACIAIPFALVFVPVWRARMFAYARQLNSARATWIAYRTIAVKGVSVMAETATGTIYQSAAILFATAALGLTGAASLKVLMGFLGAATLAFAPLTKWMTFHLPRRLREAEHPQREFAFWTLIGGLSGIALYAAMLAIGPSLIPIVYGSRYAGAGALVPAGGLIAVVWGFSLNLSIISKMYNLVWTFVVTSAIAVLLGLAFLASPWRPSTLIEISVFYALWSLPSSVLALCIAYRRLAAPPPRIIS